MPLFNDPLTSILSQLTKSTDGALIGIGFAYIAVQSWRNFNSTTSALRQISQTPEIPISDLRSILSDGEKSYEGKMVFVRGIVEAKSTIEASNMMRSDVIIAPNSGELALVLERSTRCLNNRWAEIRLKDLLEWIANSKFISKWAKGCVSTRKTVPFVLLEKDRWPCLDYLIVNIDGSRHPLPLTTVYHQIQPVQVSPSTFLLALTGHPYTIGILDEEKILPPAKEICAIGVCSLKDGELQIESSKRLPYFLSNMAKDEMVTDLAHKTRVLFWSGIILGSMSLGILGYAISRNWRKLKEWRRQRLIAVAQTRLYQESKEEPEESDEDPGEVLDGQLCVICVRRRKKSVFVPCGHLVCCRQCALIVERDSGPKCPVCRQDITSSVRIYDS